MSTPRISPALSVNAGGVAGGPVRLLRAKPLQWIGARSYAIYLWHFPILILADREWGPLPAGTRVLLLVLSGALLLSEPGAAHATVYAQIEGTGSTWSQLIVQQWISDVDALGIVPCDGDAHDPPGVGVDRRLKELLAR